MDAFADNEGNVKDILCAELVFDGDIMCWRNFLFRCAHATYRLLEHKLQSDDLGEAWTSIDKHLARDIIRLLRQAAVATGRRSSWNGFSKQCARMLRDYLCGAYPHSGKSKTIQVLVDKCVRLAVDLIRAKAILSGHTAVWGALVDEYSDRVYSTARRMCCNRGCTRYRQDQAGSSKCSGCDDLEDAWTFVQFQIRNKCIRVYKGRCALSTFLFPLFFSQPAADSRRNDAGSGRSYTYGQLLTDFIRHKYGRVRPPRWIDELGQLHSRAFVELIHGHDNDDVAARLRLTTDEANQLPAIVDEILELCRTRGKVAHIRELLPAKRRRLETISFSQIEDDDPDGNSDPTETISAPNSTEPTVIGDAMQEALRSGLGILPSEERAIVEAYYYHHLNDRQIGVALGIPAKKVHILRHRALNQLREHLGEWL